jgi:hypothetical protein
MGARQDKRVAIDHAGRVETEQGASHACIVQDISARGARLLLPEAADVPQDFTLSLDPGGESWACRVVWRRLGEVGIAFL